MGKKPIHTTPRLPSTPDAWVGRGRNPEVRDEDAAPAPDAVEQPAAVPAEDRQAEPPRPQRRPGKTPAPAPTPRESYVVTTIRITAAQAHALRLAALELQAQQGGKADASEVLRQILDAWIAGRGR